MANARSRQPNPEATASGDEEPAADANASFWRIGAARPDAKERGIPLGGWHDFKHTLTTTMHRNGVHPKLISSILGHAKTIRQTAANASGLAFTREAGTK